MPGAVEEQSNGKEEVISAEQEKTKKTAARSSSLLELKLANQELYVPINLWFFLIVLLFLLAWVIIEIYVPKSGSLTQSMICALFNLNPQTKDVDITDTKGSIYEFWTPSVDTPQSFYPQKAWESMDKKKQRWYILDDGEDTLRKFGHTLMDVGATGYSYVEAYGQGTSAFKKGLVWEVTFPQDSAMSPIAFIQLYHRFFHRDKNIYLKIYGADATRASRGPKGEIILTHKEKP